VRAKLNPKLNWPARALRMFPPHIEFDSLRRKRTLPVAPRAGPGNRRRHDFRNQKVHTGSRNTPSREYSLKLIVNGMPREVSAIRMKRNGK
jgi:hypothetical protein